MNTNKRECLWRNACRRLACLIGCALALVAPKTHAAVPAYQETIETPHWRWEEQHAGGTIRALFLTPSMAIREPDELAQRFDIVAEVLGVGGQPPNGLKVDNARLATLLEKEYDAIVLTSYYARDMFDQWTPENRQRVLEMVRNGAALIVSRGYGKWPPAKPVIRSADDLLDDLLAGAPVAPRVVADGRLELGESDHDTADPVIAQAAEVARALPAPLERVGTGSRRTHGPFYRGGLSTVTLPLGRGRVVYTYGTSGHWISFNVFLGEDGAFPVHGNPGAFFDDPVAPELFYAVAARWLRAAVGKEAAVRVSAAAVTVDPVAVGRPTALQLTLAGDTADGDTLAWTLYSPYAEVLETGTTAVTAAQRDIDLTLTPRQAGPLLCRWRLERGDTTLDSGAAAFVAEAPATIAAVVVPEAVIPAEGLAVTWQLTGKPADDDRMALHLYDSDGRLLAAHAFPAVAGRGALAPWLNRTVGLTLRAMLLQGETLIDERRVAVQARVDRRDDLDDYFVATWGMEGGMGTWQGRQRMPLLRDLGIMAVSGQGSDTFCRTVSEAGLRPTLCNIFHPNARTRPSYDAAQAEERLTSIATTAARYSPVGYMLGDEPGDLADVADYTRHAAAIIREQDPGARVGWSGVWLSFKNDVPDFFNTCDYVTAYSPHHLYTPNLWLGVERDLYRSFARPDGILTCWTHYAPWADHEPYSRTVPWLWLFEGMNGVSYFSSAGEFAILPEDLHTSHETRWWSEEVHELQRGIGKQLIGMARETGSVRILFSRHAGGSEIWMRALNQVNIPYRLASRDELAAGLGPDVRLLICPEPLTLSDPEIEGLRTCAAAGGVVVMIGPAMTNANTRLEELFGVRRTAAESDRKTYGNIRTDITLADADPTGAPLVLNGKTSGEHGLMATDGHAVGTFQKLGERMPDGDFTEMEFLKALFATPAAVAKTHGDGLALYLAFQPDLDSAKRWLPLLAARAHARGPAARVTAQGTDNDTIYLFPFAGGGIRMLGIVQDYWRVSPAWEVTAATDVKETALYYHHGPKIWGEQQAVLRLDERAHLYDARRGAYLGQVSQAPFALQAGRPELFALLPYKVDSLTLEVPPHAAPGESITLGLRLHTTGGEPGRHVIHVALTDPRGAQLPGDRFNVALEHGEGAVPVQLPLNAAVGAWRVTARDAVTGTEATVGFSVAMAPSPPPGPLLTLARPIVHRTALPWPQGKQVSHAETLQQQEAAKRGKVEVSGAQLTSYALPRHWGRYQNQKGLRSTFSLRNAEAFYQMRYEVCNDYEANGWEKGRIWTHYRPGLGINRPNGMAWYYNGYLEVWLDDFCTADYAATAIAASDAGNNGRVDVTFTTPRGEIVLSFAMMPDHLGLFQQLEIRPTAPVASVKLAFRRYGWGGKGNPHSFIEVDPEEKSWALTGDRLEDRAFGKGPGPAAMLILPGQWDKSLFTPPHPTFEKNVALRAGDSYKAQWTLWIFPEFSNERAHNYLRDEAADTRERLQKLFNHTP